jgi:hypothetical protein
MMCQGCEDFLEYERTIDAYLNAVLPAMMAQPLDTDVLMGKVAYRPDRSS